MATSMVTNFKTTLTLGLTSGGSETTITLGSVTTTDGHTLAMSDIGDIGFIVIAPGTSNMEICSFTGISGTSLTGVTRGLPFYGTSTSAVTANKKAHGSGEIVIISNNHHWFSEQYVTTDDTQTISGVKTFSVLPVTTAGNPTDDTEFARKAYVDLVGTGLATTNKLIIAGTAGATLAAGDLIYLDTADGEWKLCDADTAASVENILLGIAQGAGTDGNAITSGVLIKGLDSNQTGLTANTKYYASNTAGDISSSAGTKEVTIGFAVSTTSIIFAPRYDQQITEDIQDALVGSSGTPSSSNKYVTEDDVSAAAGSGKIVRASGTQLPALDASQLTNIILAASIVRGETINGATTPVPSVLINDLLQDDYGDTSTTLNFGKVTTGNKIALKIIPRVDCTLSSIKLYLKKNGSPTDNATVEIQTDNAGAPSGTAVTNATGSTAGSGLTTSFALTSINFAGSVALTAGTTYWVVLSRSSTTSDTNYYIADGILAANAYASFTGSTNNASSWSTGADLPYVQLINSGAGSISAWRSDANHANYKMRYFSGFVKDDGAAGASTSFVMRGVLAGFTALIPGQTYYVSDTIGTFDTAPGTTESIVGVAVSATQMAIGLSAEKRQYIGSTSISVSSGNTVYKAPPGARYATVAAGSSGLIGQDKDFVLDKFGRTSATYSFDGPSAGDDGSYTFVWGTVGITVTESSDPNSDASIGGTIYWYR